jgi:hypothetical protein
LEKSIAIGRPVAEGRGAVDAAVWASAWALTAKQAKAAVMLDLNPKIPPNQPERGDVGMAFV